MAGNTIGQLFRVTTFGESHGLALGCIVDGVPPGISLTEADLQHDLDRRRPGTSRYTTQRREPDQVKILRRVRGRYHRHQHWPVDRKYRSAFTGLRCD